ncbi:MAG: hypothetical protein EA406_08365 [Rhodospirillales bacterium]|nr:MAG: hypothetical protein EA406_08365 [Rhodospirillales bacterium]
MNVQIRDAAVLDALKPLELAAYLRAKGWRRKADINGKGSLWLVELPDGEEFDVTLPLRQDLADYALRMGELLQTVAQVEGRSELEVLRDLMTTTADLVRVRATGHGADNGSLPLELAVTLVERSRDMILSAACATLEKRPSFAKRKPQQAMDYLRQVRLGQTEHGSYVLTILSPVSPELKAAQGELPGLEPVQPYERRVIRTLMGGLTALGEAARAAALDGSMQPFADAVERGVSANLCEAVVGLSEVGSGAPIDVRVSWSRSRPVDPKASVRVALSSDSIPIIREAARHFRERTPLEDFEVEGFVTRLNRGPAAKAGEVTVQASVDGPMRPITMELVPDDYTKAVKAHDDRLKVRCTGELAQEGRGLRLQNPRQFEVTAYEDND